MVNTGSAGGARSLDRAARRRHRFVQMWNHRYLYLLLLLPIVYYRILQPATIY